MVGLLSGVCPDLTPEDMEMKQRLGKCRPRVYSELIKSDLPGSLGVSLSSSSHFKSPLLLAMETSSCEANSGRTSGPCRAVGEKEEKS